VADYYTKISMTIELDSAEERVWLDERIQQISLEKWLDDEGMELADLSEAERAEDYTYLLACDFTYQDGGKTLWIHGDEAPELDLIALVLGEYLEKFHPDRYIEMEYGFDASKPRLDAYGGGAAFITAKETKWMHTSGWLEQQAAEFEKGVEE
jgi:hypothetical protein